jgi:hypothetical protein
MVMLAVPKRLGVDIREGAINGVCRAGNRVRRVYECAANAVERVCQAISYQVHHFSYSRFAEPEATSGLLASKNAKEYHKISRDRADGNRPGRPRSGRSNADGSSGHRIRRGQDGAARYD